MFLTPFLLAVAAFVLWAEATPASITPALGKRSISQDLLDDFVRYTKYSSGAYQVLCPSPLGNTLVVQFSDLVTNTQGFIARDDSRKEIVVSYRGSLQAQDFLTDVDIILVPFSSQGVSSVQTNGVTAHQGFLTAFNSVASVIISTVTEQLKQFPSYSLVSTGHSLGASLASLGGVSLAANFPGHPLKVFTFGQPRTGNPAYATMAENLIGVNNIFRAVHTFDGVPTIIPEAIGYRHHATEFWNFVDPPLTSTVKQCSGEEDPTCSDSIPSTGINVAHVTYFGQAIALDPTVCI
ncbi:alpha/beta-hydrolase [Schizopora paradoxa]|uniref:Alpha/beta-hydrolase n=1 Tax=Schizopora paradoxa TaxID=27342 RepID=A0A0H2QZZ6_9AGAM|nr:alpha/beta-hydrolase [Schizopora paradoxa]KLO05085.1 alpha/beta-hydrolase [Schizopora paradoxa]